MVDEMTDETNDPLNNDPKLARYTDLLRVAHEKTDQEVVAMLEVQHANKYKEVLRLKNYVDLITRLRRKLELLHGEAGEGKPLFANETAVRDLIDFIHRFGLDAIQEVYNPELKVDERRMARTAIDETTLRLLGMEPADGLTDSLGELLDATRDFLPSGP